jgi:F420-0:gamma-glutamyl ligase
VALAEGRTFTPIDETEKLEYIKKEGEYIAQTKYVHLSIMDGMYVANAGIDESNANGKCILLPKDSYQSAYRLWLTFQERYTFTNLGIIVTDSRTAPLRKWTTGVSLGHMGFVWLRDYVGKSDLFGRSFHFSCVNVADSLATAAVYTMGEWDECQPLAIIKDSQVTYTNVRQNGDELIIDPEDDMYRPLFHI